MRFDKYYRLMPKMASDEDLEEIHEVNSIPLTLNP